jgi:hypothetical protein
MITLTVYFAVQVGQVGQVVDSASMKINFHLDDMKPLPVLSQTTARYPKARTITMRAVRAMMRAVMRASQFVELLSSVPVLFQISAALLLVLAKITTAAAAT